MKIDPDIVPPQPQPALPAPPAPPGETSPFETMLTEPPAAGPSRAAASRPQKPRANAAQPATPEPQARPAKVRPAPMEPPAAPVQATAASGPAAPSPGSPVTASPAPSGALVSPADLTVAKSAAVSAAPIAEETAWAPAPPTDAPSEPKPAPPRTPDRPHRDHAFNFRELGVWGLGRLSEDGAPPRTCGVEPAPAVKNPRGDQPVRADRLLEAGPEPRPPEREPGGRPMARDPAPDLDRPGPAREVALPRWGRPDRPSPPPLMRTAAFGPSDATDLEIGNAAAEPPAAPPDGASPVNVVVSDGAGGVQVAAILPDINPDTVARLRRIAESLARELGLSLAGFSLNGVTIDAPANPDRSPQWR